MRTKEEKRVISMIALFAIISIFAISLASAASCGTGDTAGIQAYWQGEVDGTDIINGQNGQPVLAGGTISYTNGIVGNAFEFNAPVLYYANPRMVVPGSLLNVWAKSTKNQMTVEGLIYLDSNNPATLGQDVYMIEDRINFACTLLVNTMDYRTITESGVTRFISNRGTPGSIPHPYGLWSTDLGFPLQTHTWYHVAMTYDGSQVLNYLNGQQVGPPNFYSSGIAPMGEYTFGTFAGKPGMFKIDELAVYSNALSPTDIAAHSALAFSGQHYCGEAPADSDSDGIPDTTDNCVNEINPDQLNKDAQNGGDVCDVCPEDVNDSCNQQKSGGEYIPQAGGSVTNQDNSLTVTVPASATSGSSFAMQEAAGTDLTVKTGAVQLAAFNVEPSGAVFNQPVTLSAVVSTTALTQKQINSITFYMRRDDGTWTSYPTTRTEILGDGIGDNDGICEPNEKCTAQTSVTHFSVYAVGYLEAEHSQEISGSLFETGIYVIDACAHDLADNSACAEKFIYLDMDKPVTSDNYDYNNVWTNIDASISLSADDYVSNVFATYYCFGQSCNPNIAGTIISVSDEGISHINYNSVDNAGNAEDARQITVKIDKSSPVTAASYSGTQGDNNYYTSNVQIDLNANDIYSGVDKTYICVDQDNTCAPVQGTSAAITSEGNHYVRYYSADKVGNSELMKSDLIKIDKTAPEITINSLPQFDGDGDYVVSWTATDNIATSLTYEVYRSTSLQQTPELYTTTSDTSIEESNPSEGITYTYSVKAIDWAGNSENSEETSTTIDLLPPSIPILNPLPQYTTIASVDLGWNNAVDAVSGVKNYDIYKNLAHLIERAYGINQYADNAVSDNTLYSYAITSTDNVGHESQKSDATSTTMDLNDPVTSITVSGIEGDNNWYKETDIGVSFSSEDLTSGIKQILYQINGQGFNEYAGAFTLSDGEYNIEYYAIDNAGNTESIKSSEVKVDTQKPATSDSAPSAWQTQNINVALTATDNLAGIAKTLYCTDTTATCMPSATGTSVLVSEESANNYINYYSVDKAGNIEEMKTSAPIKLDKTAPVTTSDYSYNNQWSNLPSAIVSLNALDSVSGVKQTDYCIDGACDTYLGPLVFNADNVFNLTYHSIDIAGNTESIKETIIKLDATPPTINLNITPKTWASCAGGGFFFWLIWFVDSGQVTYPLVHGCVEVTANIDASISGLDNYNIKIYDENNAIVASSTDSGVDFNFDTSMNSYRIVVEALDNANNYGTTSLQVYEDDDQDYVPDILDMCPTIRPAEGMDVNPKDGCPDETGVPSTAWDKCIGIYSGSAATSIYPIDVVNVFTNKTFVSHGDTWYNFNTNMSGIDTVSYIDIDSHGNVLKCAFDLKEFDSTKEKPFMDIGRWHRCHKYGIIDKDVKINEENNTHDYHGYNLVEAWKLDLDDGSKIRANQHYNMNSGKTTIRVTYENKYEEWKCYGACWDVKRACMNGVIQCYGSCDSAKRACMNNADSCSDQCDSAKNLCIAGCGKNSQCKKACYSTADNCERGCNSQRAACWSNSEACKNPCNTQKDACDDANRICNDNCRDDNNLNIKQVYTGMKTISLYDVMKLIGYA